MKIECNVIFQALAVSDHYPIHLSLLGATVTDEDWGDTESGDGIDDISEELEDLKLEL